jgi:hypothetical protein
MLPVFDRIRNAEIRMSLFEEQMSASGERRYDRYTE